MNDDSGVLIAFLRAQLDEDERIARSAAAVGYADSRSLPAPEGHWGLSDVSAHWRDDDGEDNPSARHIARWDPARMLGDATHIGEVDAKRKIIELCESAIEAGQIEPLSTWNDDAAGAEVGEMVLRLMVQPYADWPGYDPAWSVEHEQ